VVSNLDHVTQHAALRLPRQKLQERREVGGFELFGGQELPVDRAQLVLQLHDAAVDEPCNGAARAGEYAAIHGEALSFDGKDEAVRRFVAPFGESSLFLQTVKGAVYFDRR